MDLRFTRPSPATVIALTALVVAGVGTAIAEPGPSSKTVSQQDVKRIVRQQVKKLAPDLHVARAQTAAHAHTATDATTLQGTALGKIQKRVRWALVSSSGSVLSQSGGIEVSGHPAAPPGLYYLDFGGPTAGKSIVATGLYPSASAAPGPFAARACGSAPDAMVCNANGDPAGDPNDGNHLLVVTYDSNPNTVQNDEPFYVALIP